MLGEKTGSATSYLIGDLVVLSVQKAEPRKSVKKKDVLHAVVVRTVKEAKRKDGSYIRFDENAVVVLEKGKKEPLAGRVFGTTTLSMTRGLYRTSCFAKYRAACRISSTVELSAICFISSIGRDGFGEADRRAPAAMSSIC